MLNNNSIAKCSMVALATCMLMVVTSTSVQAQNEKALKEDKQQVRTWNQFAKRLFALHELQMTQHAVTTQTSQGGYAHQKDVYTETRYYDKQTHQLLGRIQRMNDKQHVIQEIEVNIYNAKGQIVRDYLAAYLPYNRNAPIQTLINLHGYHDGLHAFRQFDASGNRIYEQCQGKFDGKPVMLSLEEDAIEPGPGYDSKTVKSAEYQACFAGIAMNAKRYLDPMNEVSKTTPEQNTLTDGDDPEKLIAMLSEGLQQDPRNVELLIRRGDLYFQTGDFELAIADYSDAIELDPHADAAYFGRGMARGRYGQIREGIQDLSVYIQRHPKDSRAYTKRGVRHLWARQEKLAKLDFQRAVKLNPANAEAHDDLGVIHARHRDYTGALKHFDAAVKHDPTYFKAFHNQAMVYYITGHDVLALNAVDHALSLMPDQRNSVLLKADILKALGQTAEAESLKADGEFLPEGNWSERIPVK